MHSVSVAVQVDGEAVICGVQVLAVEVHSGTPAPRAHRLTARARDSSDQAVGLPFASSDDWLCRRWAELLGAVGMPCDYMCRSCAISVYLSLWRG